MRTCCWCLAAFLVTIAPAAADGGDGPAERACAPAWQNALFPGFATGSFVQDDRFGGTIQLAGQLAGLACLGVGVGMLEDWIPSASWTEGAAWLVAGTGVSLGSRFWGLVRATAYDDAIKRGWQGDDALPLASGASPALLNVFLGFGSGSLLHDDVLGAAIGFLGETFGYGLLIWWDHDASRTMDGLGWENLLLYASCGMVIAARGVWGIMRPTWFAQR